MEARREITRTDGRKGSTIVRERSGTNRDWLIERARELGIRPPVTMVHLRVRTLRSAG